MVREIIDFGKFDLEIGVDPMTFTSSQGVDVSHWRVREDLGSDVLESPCQVN